MDTALKELIRDYPFMETPEFASRLKAMDKAAIEGVLQALLAMYYKDLNSSTLREMAVVLKMGFEPNEDKLGYDGCLKDPSTGDKVYCEVKPKNVRKEGAKRKLDGGGNFTDYSWRKFDRHKEENPVMLVAGFVDAHIIYIFRFPFRTDDFLNRLKVQLERRLPDGDKSGEYLRSANFNFKYYVDSPDLQTHCFVKEHELDDIYKDRITGPVRQHLKDHLRESAP